MLATSMTARTDKREISPDSNWATFLPSPLLLQLVIENGWKVTKTELAPSEDQSRLLYLVTLKSDTCLLDHQLVLPKTALIEKILDENLGVAVSAN